jgi:AcrR family transcriptional regulator
MSRSRTSIGNVRNPDTHAAILDAAAALLAEHGYAGVSMEAVARRAGAGKPTLYRWWPSKAALLMEVYERELMEVYEREKAALHADDPDLGSAQAELVRLLRNIFAFWRDTPSGQAFRSIVAEAQADPAALRALRDEFVPRARIGARTILARAKARGEIPAETDEELLLDLLFGFSWYRLLTHQLRDENGAVERAVAALLAAAVAPGHPLAAAGHEAQAAQDTGQRNDHAQGARRPETPKPRARDRGRRAQP